MLKIGSIDINKLYLGNSEVNKMYLGADLVFENSIQPSELTPIMMNFRVNDDTPDRVYFDVVGSISGMTTEGFVISGKNILSVDSTLNYFTVDTPFNFWDQAITIRLGENDDTFNEVQVNPALYNFTLDSVYNLIDEPAAATNMYVAVGGSGDGTSEVNAASLTFMADNAAPGETWWIKIGDYGNENISILNNGQIGNPIKYIGYNTLIGDITTNYLQSFSDISNNWSSNEMPTLTGDDSGTAITLGCEYSIIRNLQATNYYRTMLPGGIINSVIIENFNFKDNNTTNEHSGINLINSNANKVTIRGGVSLDIELNGCVIQSSNDGFHLYENLKAYSSSGFDQDYYLSLNGSNNIIRKCEVYADSEITSNHGIGIKATGTLRDNNWNLIEDNHSTAIAESYYVRNNRTYYNVFKDNYAEGTEGTGDNRSSGFYFWGGARYNIVERNEFKGLRARGIVLQDNDETPSHDEVGAYNIVRNNIFDGMAKAVLWSTSPTASLFNDNYFYNNTFINSPQLYDINPDNPNAVIQNLHWKNNIFKDILGATDGTPGMIFDYNDFDNSWTTGIGANDINIDPQLDANYLPSNESLTVPKLAQANYDYNSKERAETTTIGGVTLTSENAGTQPPITGLTPIMMNFRVEDANKDRVYFDTPLGPVTDLTIQGFAINGRTILEVDDVNNYFTLSAALDWYDNKTIELVGGDGTVFDFTREAISNDITIPNSFITRYVTPTGAGDHSGIGEANAWNPSEIALTGGMRVAIKVGDYTGSLIYVDAVDGFDNGPTVFEGYQVEIGDITDNYWTYGDALDSAEMPLFDGQGADNLRGIFIKDSSHTIIRNLQFKNFGVYPNTNNYGVSLEGTNRTIIENVNSEETNRNIFCIGDSTRIINSNVVNGWEFNFSFHGSENVYLGCESYCNDTSSEGIGTDYYFNMVGDRNICKDSYTKRDGNVLHSGHGVSMHGDPALSLTSQYNLVDNLTSVNMLAAFELRHFESAYNVVKRSNSYGEGVGGDGVGGIHIRDGAHDNIIENTKVDLGFNVLGSTQPLIYFQDFDGQSGDGFGSDNIIRNCIFNDAYLGIVFNNNTAAVDPTGSGNQILNCTFNNVEYWIREYNVVSGMSGTLIKNCILNLLRFESFGAYVSTFTYQYDNIFDSWTNTIGTDSSNLNPDFLVDFVPQAETMKAPTIIEVPYDYNSDQRDETETTIGAVMLVSEKQ